MESIAGIALGLAILVPVIVVLTLEAKTKRQAAQIADLLERNRGLFTLAERAVRLNTRYAELFAELRSQPDTEADTWSKNPATKHAWQSNPEKPKA